MWISLVLHVANIAGYLRVPLFIVMIAILVAGFMEEANSQDKKQEQLKCMYFYYL